MCVQMWSLYICLRKSKDLWECLIFRKYTIINDNMLYSNVQRLHNYGCLRLLNGNSVYTDDFIMFYLL